MVEERIPPQAFPMEIAPGIYVLGNYFFNLFLVTGPEKSVLFETGISAVVDRVIGQLEGLGAAPDLIVVSHPHADHITGLPGLRERFPEAEIMAAVGAAEFVSHPKAGAAMIQEDRFMAERLAALGIIPGRQSLAAVPELAGHTVIEKRHRLELGGGRALELIPAEGHSPGSLIAWMEGERILFCSDSLGFHYPGRGIWPLFFTGAAAYLETLDLMAKLAPKILCPAHQGPIQGREVTACLDMARKAAEDLIRRATRERDDDEALADALFEASYRDEFTLYTRSNISNCNHLLIRRARESLANG